MSTPKLKLSKLSPLLKNASPTLHVNCGVGWFNLLLEFHDKAVRIDPKYVFLGAKEKYAQIQIAFKSETHYELIRNIENEIAGRSIEICELCGGEAGRCEINSWEKNYCDSCFDNVVKINNYEDTTAKPIRTAISRS